MAEVARLTSALKKHLKARGVTYGALAKKLDISEASVKRVFATGSFTLRRLGQVCEVLELEFLDLAKLAHDRIPPGSRLSADQEEALAANRRLLLIFHLLLNEWSIEEIVSHYQLSRKDVLTQVRNLKELKLIDLGPQNKVRLRTARNIDWRRDGPIRKVYQKQLVAEFFDSAFDAGDRILRFDGKELSGSSIAVMTKKIDRLLRDFEELAEIDAPLKREDKQSVVLISAIRPYVLSSFAEMKRKGHAPAWPAMSRRNRASG
jgi:hypothetical protein